MAADPREIVLFDGWAVTGVNSAAQQSIITGGWAGRVVARLTLAFGAAMRRFRFGRSVR